ncbi:hypothetical protein HNQ07_001390 [Deinococcus metalli]|uniref:Uncharacterized protein n=1 Tax=Deinococcus metalli TaxID=1141878 RepID=A0A7W8NQJ6_9DEIO|nr:hypothetical protein [Deinococcus metalli]MBB5375933.1 hypothetical protein [Deinococcus metalli]
MSADDRHQHSREQDGDDIAARNRAAIEDPPEFPRPNVTPVEAKHGLPQKGGIAGGLHLETPHVNQV